LAELPLGYEGEFGPGIKTLIISLYYGGNMTQGKLLEFLYEVKSDRSWQSFQTFPAFTNRHLQNKN